MVNSKKFVSLYIASLVFIIFYIYMITHNISTNKSLLTVFLFFIVQAVSLVNLLNSIRKKPYSLNMMHWFFVFIFYGMAGFIQYMHNRFPWSTTASDETLQKVLLVIILWIFSYMFGSKITLKFDKKFKVKFEGLNSKLHYTNNFVILSTLISVSILVLVLSTVGIEASLSRGGPSAFEHDTQIGGLLLNSIFRNVIVYGLAISIINVKKNRKGGLWVIVQVLCLSIVNSPISMARFNVAIIYLGLLLLTFSFMKKGIKFILIFFFSFILIFPTINAFRNLSFGDISLQAVFNDTVNGVATELLAGDYDAFAMIVNTFDYVSENGSTLGTQLLGALLFFIPRVFWPSKPEGSGHTVLLARGAQFTNVSSPLIAEGLVNFNIIGVIIFAFFFGKFTSYIDKMYWKGEHRKEHRIIDIIYPFMLFMFFFMNRGDLLSTFSFAMGHIVVFLIMFKLNNITSYIKTK